MAKYFLLFHGFETAGKCFILHKGQNQLCLLLNNTVLIWWREDKKTQGNTILKLGWHNCLVSPFIIGSLVSSSKLLGVQASPVLCSACLSCSVPWLCSHLVEGRLQPLPAAACPRPPLPKTSHQVLCDFCCNKLHKAATHRACKSWLCVLSQWWSE